MTDIEYLDRAEALLTAIELACDRINVTWTFANRSQIIVNLQKPLQEVWMAARAGGFHYRYDGAQWMDSKGQGEFFSHLSRCATEQAGQPLTFSS